MRADRQRAAGGVSAAMLDGARLGGTGTTDARRRAPDNLALRQGAQGPPSCARRARVRVFRGRDEDGVLSATIVPRCEPEADDGISMESVTHATTVRGSRPGISRMRISTARRYLRKLSVLRTRPRRMRQRCARGAATARKVRLAFASTARWTDRSSRARRRCMGISCARGALARPRRPARKAPECD